MDRSIIISSQDVETLSQHTNPEHSLFNIRILIPSQNSSRPFIILFILRKEEPTSISKRNPKDAFLAFFCFSRKQNQNAVPKLFQNLSESCNGGRI